MAAFISSTIWIGTDVSVPFRSSGELEPLKETFPRPSSPVTVITLADPLGTEKVVTRLSVLDVTGIDCEMVVISDAVTVMVIFLTIEGMFDAVTSGSTPWKSFLDESAVPILRVTLVELPSFPLPEQDAIKIMARMSKTILKYADFMDSSIC